MNRPFQTNRMRFGRFTIDLLHLLGKIMQLQFKNNTLKALLLIELRKYEGQALKLSLKKRYQIAKRNRF